MDMYKKASKLGLTFATTKGQLSVNDLWDLNLEQLNVIAKDLNKKLKESSEDFLDEKPKEDTVTKLKFDIVIDILNDKKIEKQNRTLAIKNKEEKEKILAILARKEYDALDSQSIDDLKKRLTELA